MRASPAFLAFVCCLPLAAACGRGGKEKTGRAPDMDSACESSDKTDKPEARWTKPEDGFVAGACDEIFVDWGGKDPDGVKFEGQRNLWCCEPP